MQKRQAEFQQRQESGELSDEELEAVAGGMPPPSLLLRCYQQAAKTTCIKYGRIEKP